MTPTCLIVKRELAYQRGNSQKRAGPEETAKVRCGGKDGVVVNKK